MTSQSWPSSSLESQGPRPKARFNSCQETVQPLYATRMISQGSFTVEGSSHVNCLREIPANLQPMNTNMLLWMLSHHISGKILSQFFTDPEAMPVGCGWFLIFLDKTPRIIKNWNGKSSWGIWALMARSAARLSFKQAPAPARHDDSLGANNATIY